MIRAAAVILCLLSSSIHAQNVGQAFDRATGGAFEGWKPGRKPLDPVKKGAENVAKETDKLTGGASRVVTEPARAVGDWFDGWKPARRPLTPIERALEDGADGAQSLAEWGQVVGDALFTNRHWPKPFPAQLRAPLSAPAIDITIRPATVNQILGLYAGESIPLKSQSDHVLLGPSTIELDPDRGVWKLNTRDGKLRYNFMRRNSFHIRSANIELIPLVRREGESVHVDIVARCTRFDIADCPGELDRVIAHVFNEALAGRGGRIASIDVTDAFDLEIDLQTLSGRNAVPQIGDFATFLDERGIRLQAEITFAKR